MGDSGPGKDQTKRCECRSFQQFARVWNRGEAYWKSGNLCGPLFWYANRHLCRMIDDRGRESFNLSHVEQLQLDSPFGATADNTWLLQASRISRAAYILAEGSSKALVRNKLGLGLGEGNREDRPHAVPDIRAEDQRDAQTALLEGPSRELPCSTCP